MEPKSLIWWTSERDCHLVDAIFETDGSEDSALGSPTWPDYLRSQYNSRHGRNGRGRLWADISLSDVDVRPWPTTPFARELRENYGGIVIRPEHMHHVASLPGIVTGLDLVIASSP